MSRAKGFLKVIFMLLLLIAVLIGGLLWFDFLGIINAQTPLKYVNGLLGISPQEELVDPLDSPYLLDEERLAKRQKAVELKLKEISADKETQKVQENELLQWSEELSEREKAVSEKEKSLNEALKLYDNKRANLEQMATYWGEMSPENAVAIMLNMNSLDVVDVLRTSERLAQEAGKASLVAYWISLMPADKAAEIQRLMTRDAEE
jgi:flagellar protein FlbB